MHGQVYICCLCVCLSSLCLLCFFSQYKEFGLQGDELWLAVSADRRVSVWAADWKKDKCELLDWLSFPAPAAPEVS